MGPLVRLLTLCWLALAVQGTGQEEYRPLLATKYGKLLGTVTPVKGTERKVHTFLGIPFAKPPIGELRFARPEPPVPWSNIRDTSDHPPMCLQNTASMEALRDYFQGVLILPPISEDCLFLNVYTPADRGQNARKPVMVFIHGGGLVMGGASIFDGSALSAYEDVVIVAIQYRLGLLGYFSTGDEEAPGNYGFFDQVVALHWVQENIEDFGGDPQSVTIFGESAGGVSVAALVASPLSKGLFHRAIAESGTAIIPALMGGEPEQMRAYRNIIANISGCDPATVVDCLKEKNEEEIVEIIVAMTVLILPGTVDGEFFPKPVDEILANKESNNVPFIIGVSEQEFGWILPMIMNITGLREGMDRDTVELTLRALPYMSADIVGLVLEEYLGDTDDPLEIRNRFLDMCGDVMFVMPALKTATYHRDSGFLVYFYEFQHRPSIFKDIKPDFVKADHGDELLYVMGSPFLTGLDIFRGNATEEEKVLSKTIMNYWANFARNGDPNGPGLAKWPEYDDDEDYLQINLEQKTASKLKQRRLKFWTKILPEKIQKQSEEEHTEL
ncbi:fatty acyl-CoA hydrolase precursor, medium chain-like isoform 2-T2 [Pelodytes ibericus]